MVCCLLVVEKHRFIVNGWLIEGRLPQSQSMSHFKWAFSCSVFSFDCNFTSTCTISHSFSQCLHKKAMDEADRGMKEREKPRTPCIYTKWIVFQYQVKSQKCSSQSFIKFLWSISLIAVFVREKNTAKELVWSPENDQKREQMTCSRACKKTKSNVLYFCLLLRNASNFLQEMPTLADKSKSPRHFDDSLSNHCFVNES